jgi:hypothetical protein
MRRYEVPSLRDAAAWAKFPASLYNLIIIDALDSTAEGIGEQDSAKPSKAIAPVLDLARGENGPAILVLGNCTKDAKHSRGSGVIEDRSDICIEARDATNFQPTGTKPWFEELPPAGADAWAARAARRKGRDSYRLSLTFSKFRTGREPDPMMLEIDLGINPWTVRDVTADVIAASEQARQKSAGERAQQPDKAAAVLAANLHHRAASGTAMPTTTEAEGILRATGLTRKDARALLNERSGEAWAFIEKDKKTVLVVPASQVRAVESDSLASQHEQNDFGLADSADRMNSGRRDSAARNPAKIAPSSDAKISPPPASTMLWEEV